MERLLKGGVQQVRVVLRAVALLQLDRGRSAPRVAEGIDLTAEAVRRIARRHERGGVDAAVFEAARPGAEQVLSAPEKQRIFAMVCSEPPAGAAR